MSEALKKVLTIDLDDSQLKNFYQDLRRQELNIHIEKFIVNEKANDSLVKETEKSINAGIKKGTQKGSDTFEKGFLGKLSLLETQINKSFVKPIEQIQAPINSLFSGLSSLGGIFLGGGAIGSIVSLVGSLTTRLREFSVANQKFKDSLSSSLEVRGIEYLSKNIENLSKKTNLSRDVISSFLIEMKKMGVASEDVTRHMSFLEGVLGRIGKVAPENFSKLVGILKSVEEGVKLSSKQLKTLGFLVGEEASQKIQKLGKEGRLSFESFTKTIEEFGKNSLESFDETIEAMKKQAKRVANMRSKPLQVPYGYTKSDFPVSSEKEISEQKDKLRDLFETSFRNIEVKIRLTPDKEKWQKEIEKIRDEAKTATTPVQFDVIIENVEKLRERVSHQVQSVQPSQEESDLEHLQKLQDKWTTLVNLPEESQKKIDKLSFAKLMKESYDLDKTLLGTIERLAQKAQTKEQWDFVALLSKSAQEFKRTLPPAFCEVEKNLSSLKSKIQETHKTKLTIQTHPEVFEKLKMLKKDLEAIEKIKGSLSETDLKIHMDITKEVEVIETRIKDKSELGTLFEKLWGKLDENQKAQQVSNLSGGISGVISNIGEKNSLGASLSAVNSLSSIAQMAGFLSPMGSAVIGGITSIFSAVDSFMKAGIEREMEGIRKQDALFLDEYKKTKDKEIEERKKHIKELDEQFSKTKSVYDRAFEEGAISSEEYAHHMKGASEGYQKSKKEDEDAIEVVMRQKQMLDNYISRREEIQKTKKENESWSFGVEDSESAQKLARINEAINAIQRAKSIEDLNKYPEKAINYAYHGYQGYTNKPTLFMTSELGQKEHVNITPSYRLGEENSPSGISIGNIEIHINGSGLSVNELSNELVDALFMRLQQRMQRGMYGGR